MTIKETFTAIGISALIVGFIAVGCIVIAFGTAQSNYTTPEFSNCHISADGHEMCQ